MVLHVTLQFPGGPEGVEPVELPAHWAGETLHGVTNLRALSADTSVSAGHIVRHPPNQPVVLAYDVVKDWTGPFRHPMQFHGVLMPEYLEINGDNALVHPKLTGQTMVTVNFDWQRLPKSWALATSFGTSAGPDDRCQSYSGPWRAVEDALFTAGDFRIHRFQIGRRPAVLAIRGQWTFTDDEVIADIQKVVGIVRDFFHDDNFPYFLVTLKPYDTDRGSSDGSGFTNAFWLYMSRLDPFSTQLTQLSHEAFHAWNPRRMGVPDGDEKSTDWFHEGFTRYYADLLVYRAGLLPLTTYVENTNRDLHDYPTSTSAYVRGRVFALWLDQEIRKNSDQKKSLDNVMLDMVREGDQGFTLARILETAGRYISADARGQLERAVKQGASLPAPDDALGPCAHVSMDQMATFDLGFNLAASRDANTVTGVIPDGPAFKAGLRDGQTLAGVSVYNNQPEKLARFTIQTAEGRQTLEYYPRGKAITVPQYHLTGQGCIGRDPLGR
jgi:predicted metalloprotease with PDZ domain